MIKHHCIVTSEIPQIIKNGGVGTNTLNSALFLRKIAECRCTILFVGDSRGLLPVAKKQLAGLGLELVGLEEVSAPWSTERISPVELADSLRSHWWLQRQDFDVIHFMQYQVPGFAAIRAKRLGTAYQNTPLVLIVNSPVRWLDELAQRTPEPSGRRFLIEYMEKYCVEHADHVQAPTQAMLQFFQSKNWKIRGEKHHLPTFTEKHLPREVPVRKNHFIFFGRLETRKGLGLFVEALDQLAQHRQAPPELKVTFLGKVASVYGQSSESYLHERRRNWPEEGWEVELLTEFDRQQAMEYLDDHAGSIYFIPSLGDNSPNTALECLAQRLRVLAADTPGTGELFADDYSRFSPTAEALLDKMLEALKHGVEKSRPAISEEEVRNKRLAFINRLNQPGDPAANPRLPADGDTLVSAIVPNYNLGPYLEECVKALLTQKHRNLEVIVVDDGSTEQQTQQSLQRLESLQDDHRLRLIRQENGGVCRARNTGAAEAHGQYLVFVDADNLPRPEMIETMLKQLRHAGLDALTCDLYAFDDEQPGGPQNLQFYHAFAGGCLEANCTGSA